MEIRQLLLLPIMFVICNCEGEKLNWQINEYEPVCYGISAFEVDSIHCNINGALKNNQRPLKYLITVDKNSDGITEFILAQFRYEKKIQNTNVHDIIEAILGGRNKHYCIDKYGYNCIDDNFNEKNRSLLPFFQLPRGKVQKGDVWNIKTPIDTIEQYDFNEKRLNVFVDSIKLLEKGKIAYLKYDFKIEGDVVFEENSGKKIPGSIFYVFFGYGQFNVTEGRFISFIGFSDLELKIDKVERFKYLVYLNEIDWFENFDLKLLNDRLEQRLQNQKEKKKENGVFDKLYDWFNKSELEELPVDD